jgi:levansucrase
MDLPKSMRSIAVAAAAAALVVAGCASDDDATDEQTTEAADADDQEADADDQEARADDQEADADDQEAEVVRGSAGSWTPEHVAELELAEGLTAPIIDAAIAEEPALDGYWMWDWWPVRDRGGEVATIDGWQVAVALTAPDNVLPGQRHDIAELRYLVTDDFGRTWQEGGAVFPEGDGLGSRRWAGSTMVDDDGTVYVFYTASGEDGVEAVVPTVDELREREDDNGDVENDDETAAGDDGYVTSEDISYEQRMVVAVGQLAGDDDGVTFSDWEEHTVILEGDDVHYASTAQTEGGAGEIDAFRDPWFFQDPADGSEYLLFTATMPEAECDGDGVVGIAERAADDLRSWEPLPPLLDAHCVNNELERPQVVIEDDNYYLLFTTHAHTFDEDVDGPEGLYGFVGDGLFGPYEPLNGSGLVLANPEQEPFQAYSWMVLANGIATSFFQFVGIGDEMEIGEIGEQDVDSQLESFAGTFAPSVQVEFDGASTRLGDELEPGQLAR